MWVGTMCVLGLRCTGAPPECDAVSSLSCCPSIYCVMDYDSYDHPLDDDEYPDDYDADDDWDEVELLPCPHCGVDIAEDSIRCPICGEYVTWGSSVWEGKSWWWIVLGLLGIAATILALSVM